MAIFGPLKKVTADLGAAENMHSALNYLGKVSNLDYTGLSISQSRRVAIKGEHLFAIHHFYETRLPLDEKFEGHRKYIDLQYVFSGEETIYFSSGEPAEPLMDYDEGKDCEFFGVRDYSVLRLKAGMVAIFFPGELHATGLGAGGIKAVKKSVVKLRHNSLTDLAEQRKINKTSILC